MNTADHEFTVATAMSRIRAKYELDEPLTRIHFGSVRKLADILDIYQSLKVDIEPLLDEFLGFDGFNDSGPAGFSADPIDTFCKHARRYLKAEFGYSGSNKAIKARIEREDLQDSTTAQAGPEAAKVHIDSVQEQQSAKTEQQADTFYAHGMGISW